MISLKDWNLKSLGYFIVNGVLLLILASIVMTFVSPMLVTLLPALFVTKLTLTDTLLLFILIKHFTK